MAQLRDEDISVTASNGVVTLRGKVGDPAVVQRAVDETATVAGVRRVVAKLTVEVRPG